MADQDLTRGNIYIDATADDANICKIGKIRGTTTESATGIAVLIDINGQLGTISSTRDTKKNIIRIDEEENSKIVHSFIPRRFDFIKSVYEFQQYGLIVDEIESFCPDLVAYNSSGKPETIYYQHLPILLLTEIQRQNKVDLSLREEIKELRSEVKELRDLVNLLGKK